MWYMYSKTNLHFVWQKLKMAWFQDFAKLMIWDLSINMLNNISFCNFYSNLLDCFYNFKPRLSLIYRACHVQLDSVKCAAGVQCSKEFFIARTSWSWVITYCQVPVMEIILRQPLSTARTASIFYVIFLPEWAIPSIAMDVTCKLGPSYCECVSVCLSLLPGERTHYFLGALGL